MCYAQNVEYVFDKKQHLPGQLVDKLFAYLTDTCIK